MSEDNEEMAHHSQGGGEIVPKTRAIVPHQSIFIHVPPTMGEPVPEISKSRWPTVVGVICVILASFGLLCGWAGMLQAQFLKWAADMAAQNGQPDASLEAQVVATQQFFPILVVLTVVSVGASVWLLVSAIGLLRRRAWSRMSLCGWAMTSILLVAFSVSIQHLIVAATIAELNSHGEQAAAAKAWLSGLIGLIFGLLFGLALPVFTLAWMSRAKIKAQVLEWR